MHTKENDRPELRMTSPHAEDDDECILIEEESERWYKL